MMNNFIGIYIVSKTVYMAMMLLSQTHASNMPGSLRLLSFCTVCGCVHPQGYKLHSSE